MFIELPDSNTGNCKMKIGDGNSTYENLPYAMGDGTDSIDTILSKIYKKLWTNISTSSTFNPQTITFTNPNNYYNYFLIFFYPHNGSAINNYSGNCLLKAGLKGLLSFTSEQNDTDKIIFLNYRIISASSYTSITFQGGVGVNSSGGKYASNDRCYPIEVYGIHL